ncbi:MAG: hypothetical protein XXXJIFNMEKO3_00521 [Candidatus Erwinia impunctatus]|nr:hypothetical protein XXXJIFNMEKO_00521 [Culicoides impunctatus]
MMQATNAINVRELGFFLYIKHNKSSGLFVIPRIHFMKVVGQQLGWPHEAPDNLLVSGQSVTFYFW